MNVQEALTKQNEIKFRVFRCFPIYRAQSPITQASWSAAKTMHRMSKA